MLQQWDSLEHWCGGVSGGSGWGFGDPCGNWCCRVWCRCCCAYMTPVRTLLRSVFCPVSLIQYLPSYLWPLGGFQARDKNFKDL